MKTPVPSRRATIALAWIVAIAIIAAGAWLVGKVATLGEENVNLKEQDRQSRADRSQLREDVEADRLELQALRAQLEQLGEEPIVEPGETPTPGELIVIPGPRGLSCIEEIGYPRCRGDRGRTGTEGSAGVDGSTGAPGEQGPQGPQGERGPEGPAGPAGPQGEQGPTGRSVESTFCGDDGRWLVTYSDGTASDGGICRIAPGNPNEGARR